MASRFETFSEDEILTVNEAVVQTNTKKRLALACRCLLGGIKLLFHTEFAIKL